MTVAIEQAKVDQAGDNKRKEIKRASGGRKEIRGERKSLTHFCCCVINQTNANNSSFRAQRCEISTNDGTVLVENLLAGI